MTKTEMEKARDEWVNWWKKDVAEVALLRKKAYAMKPGAYQSAIVCAAFSHEYAARELVQNARAMGGLLMLVAA